MPVAEIITIGTELLLGEIQDTNTSYIAKALNAAGIDIYHASMIGDNKERIALEICAALERADIIITTGGLGPTVDDPTRDAVAMAFNREAVFSPELWDQIQTRFKAYGRNPSKNNMRQAYIPKDAVAIPNPVGTAPAFYIEENHKIIFSLPGVPSEMKTLLQSDVLPIIKLKYPAACAIIIRTIHTAGIGESSVDELVADLEQMHNPTVGLAAHPGQVDIRITAKAKDSDHAWELIKPIEAQIRQLLGNFVYGEDEITLEKVVSDLIKQNSIDLAINYEIDFLTIADLLSRWIALPMDHLKLIQEDQFSSPESSINNEVNSRTMLINLKQQKKTEKGLIIELIYQDTKFDKIINYGGHTSQFDQWAGNHILNFLRETILNLKVLNG